MYLFLINTLVTLRKVPNQRTLEKFPFLDVIMVSLQLHNDIHFLNELVQIVFVFNSHHEVALLFDLPTFIVDLQFSALNKIAYHPEKAKREYELKKEFKYEIEDTEIFVVIAHKILIPIRLDVRIIKFAVLCELKTRIGDIHVLIVL